MPCVTQNNITAYYKRSKTRKTASSMSKQTKNRNVKHEHYQNWLMPLTLCKATRTALNLDFVNIADPQTD